MNLPGYDNLNGLNITSKYTSLNETYIVLPRVLLTE